MIPRLPGWDGESTQAHVRSGSHFCVPRTRLRRKIWPIYLAAFLDFSINSANFWSTLSISFESLTDILFPVSLLAIFFLGMAEIGVCGEEPSY